MKIKSGDNGDSSDEPRIGTQIQFFVEFNSQEGADDPVPMVGGHIFMTFAHPSKRKKMTTTEARELAQHLNDSVDMVESATVKDSGGFCSIQFTQQHTPCG